VPVPLTCDYQQQKEDYIVVLSALRAGRLTGTEKKKKNAVYA
jgi:hypothetical protein